MTAFKNRVIAITGAGGGLGLAYAKYFAVRGARLVLNDLGGARDGSGAKAGVAQEAVDICQALGAEAVANVASVASSVGAESIVATAVEAFGRLDVLINNAGILRDKVLLKMDDEQWAAVIDTHLTGTFVCSRAAAGQMVAQGDGGAIVNTTSVAALRGNFGQSNYAAAKGGIYSMTLVHALELARFNIRVNAVAPLAKTRMTEDVPMIASTMTSEHVAPMVAFLASAASENVTGRVFGVHGSHLFEYAMTTSPGVRDESWTVESIAAALPEIGRAGAGAERRSAAGGTSADTAPKLDANGMTRSILEHVPIGFDAGQAQGFNATMHWCVVGAGDFTASISPDGCVIHKGFVGKKTSDVKIDAETFVGLFSGSVDGQQAFMAGKITASDVTELMTFHRCIDSERVMAAVCAAGGRMTDERAS